MFNIMNILCMENTYDARKVGRWQKGKRFVSTCSVTDGAKPYETAFAHPNYNDGDMVIVESYNTRKQAEKGHEKWVKVMTKGPLPKVLNDCANAEVAQFLKAVGGKMTFKRKTRKGKGK